MLEITVQSVYKAVFEETSQKIELFSDGVTGLGLEGQVGDSPW